jgi:hypothetical protein
MKRQRTPLSYLLSAQTALSRRSRNVVASRDYSVNLSVPLTIVEAVCPFGAWINDLTDNRPYVPLYVTRAFISPANKMASAISRIDFLRSMLCRWRKRNASSSGSFFVFIR